METVRLDESSESRHAGSPTLKIVHVGLDLVPSIGGQLQSIRDFSRVGDSVIVSFSQPGKLANEGTAIPGTVHVETSRGPLGRFFAWAPSRNRRAALEAVADADLIVCHLLLRYHVHWVRAAARRLGIPYLAVPHGALDPYVFGYRSLVKKVWFRLFGAPFLTNAQSVVFSTEAERRKAARYYEGDNCRVIHWPVEAIDVGRRPTARDRIRGRLGIGPTEKILLQVGRVSPLKRPLETIAAFAEARVSATHLVMVGPFETISRQECLDVVERLGVESVHLVGPVYGEEKEDFLLASDGYVSLSHRENFGYTTAEALSAGLPVILSPGNALAESVGDHACGWMLQDDLSSTAAAAIRAFAASSTGELRERGERGRRWALENLTFEGFADRVRAAAGDAIQGSRRPG
jgi:glycosyltransferase involved in cell wall biosynthesis